MRAQLAFNAESATHLAGIQIDLALEHFEDADDFAQPPTGDLDEVDLTASHYPPTGFVADLQR